MLSIQELQSSAPKELLEELKNARREAFKIRMNLKAKHSKDTSLARKQKGYVALIQTFLKEAEVEEAVKNANQL